MLNMALVAELAAVLGRYGALRCAPSVEVTNDGLLLTVSLTRDAQETVRDEDAVYALYKELQQVADTATMRAICARYGIGAHWLEDALLKGDARARD